MSKHFTIEPHELYSVRNWLEREGKLIDGRHPQDLDGLSDGHLRCWIQLYLTPAEIAAARVNHTTST